MRRKKPDPYLIDEENPELTDEYFNNARPFKEAFPELYASWKRTRGKQKRPTKSQVTLRLSPEVLDYFKSTGNGWQTRIDEALLNVIHRV